MNTSTPSLTAKMAGVFYLLNIATILLAVFFFRGIVSRDPAATAANVLAHEASFRLGYALELISTACSIAVAALFYELLKPVNRSVSLTAAFFRVVACALAVVGYLFQLAPLQVAGGAHSVELYRLRGPASDMVIVFFGFQFVLIGYLIFRSTFLPRAFGALAGIAGLGGLMFLVPPLAHNLFPYFVAIGLLAELSLTAWLLAAGVDVQRWNELASTAAR
jgi:hypothetical protein